MNMNRLYAKSVFKKINNICSISLSFCVTLTDIQITNVLRAGVCMMRIKALSTHVLITKAANIAFGKVNWL
jgi:hypothetical protein